MNVHDWLMNLPFSDPESSCRIVEVSFNNGSRKDFYRNSTLQYFEKGELITVEGISGFDVGEVSLTGELVRIQLKKHRVHEDSPELKRILRRANPMDIEKWRESKGREREMLVRSRAIARSYGLHMKMAEVELQADGKKATFFYTADDRVDFRELIKTYGSEFKVKVEMKQIGSRQEAAKVGGIGSCGRELCCSTWLTDFKSVTTQAARYQNLSINQTKLSGQCGRLKCCLNYELDTYLDALQHFPNHCDVLETQRGRAILVKKDIFRNLLWYTLPETTKQYPLTIERALEIKQLNSRGEKPNELEAVEVVSSKPREVEPEFVDVVGQLSLRGLERTSRRNKEKQRAAKEGPQRPAQQGGPAGRTQQGKNRPHPQGPKPQQQGNRPQQQAMQGGEGTQQGKQGPRPPRQGGPRPPQGQGNERPPQQHRHKPGKPRTGGPPQAGSGGTSAG